MSGCDCLLCCDRRRSMLVLIGPPCVEGSSFLLRSSAMLVLCYTTATPVCYIIHMSQGIATRPSRCEDRAPPERSLINIYSFLRSKIVFTMLLRHPGKKVGSLCSLIGFLRTTCALAWLTIIMPITVFWFCWRRLVSTSFAI
jgi:hypothetical protein